MWPALCFDGMMLTVGAGAYEIRVRAGNQSYFPQVESAIWREFPGQAVGR